MHLANQRPALGAGRLLSPRPAHLLVTRLTAVRHQHSYSACKPDRPCRRAIIARVSSAAAPTQPLDLQPGSGGSAVRDPADNRVRVTFRWPAALGGQEVYIAGDFNNWQGQVPMQQSTRTGDFVRTVSLPVGTYEYKFLVDGQWRISTVDQVVKKEGVVNNHKLVTHTATFCWPAEYGDENVYLCGDFTGWHELIPMPLDPETSMFSVNCSLPPGTYHYTFLVDGRWRTLSLKDEVVDATNGIVCNKATVKPLSSFHVYYSTGWSRCSVFYRVLLENGQTESEEWQEVPLIDCPRRTRHNNSRWKSVVIPTTSNSNRLQFYIAGADSGMDVPPGCQYYTVPTPGAYKLQSGKLTPFKRALQPPTMLVSDLDGTMVGETDFADECMQQFTNYWNDTAALAGSVLVYNTGRSLGSFKQLYKQKNNKLCLPDVLITAVGTKVWLLDERSSMEDPNWVEDMNWVHRLDEGWSLDRVRKIANEVLKTLGRDQAGWLDDGSEHQHRISLSVRVDSLDYVTRTFTAQLEQKGLKARIITSGCGDWRYFDCVAYLAGKLEALEYVRRMYNMPHARCVAAGDSCNDILMLEGDNKAIVVNNAQAELLEWLVRQPQDCQRVVYADQQLASGILEGMSRLGLY